MKITSIYIEGFGSYVGATYLNLNTEGLYIIRGVNGAGKTTVFSALCWALYGKTLKEISGDEIASRVELRPASWKGTAVHVTFSLGEDEYKVCRHIGYKDKVGGLTAHSTLMVFRNGELETNVQHKSNIQEFINNLVGMDYKLFINTVLFGQRLSRFINCSNDEKRKLLENLFDLDFIADAKVRAETRMQALKVDLSGLQAGENELKKQIEANVRQIDNLHKSIGEKDALKERARIEREAMLLDYQKELVEIENERQGLAQIQAKYETVSVKLKATVAGKECLAETIEKACIDLKRQQGKVNKMLADLNQCNRDITSKERERAKLAEISVCPTCKQELPKDEEHIKLMSNALLIDIDKLKEYHVELTAEYSQESKVLDVMEASEAEMRRDMEIYVKEYNTHNQTLASYRTSLANAPKLDQQEAKIQTKIKDAETYLAELDQMFTVDRELAEMTELRETNRLAEVSIEGLREQIATLKEELTAVSWWSATGFGAAGIKTYIFNTRLHQLNSLITQYASRLGVSVVFGVDLEKASKPFYTNIYKNDNIYSYESLSGGEQQRVDICIAFALHDLITSSIRVNLLILDELFEGIDDLGGTDEIFDLIRYKSVGRAVFVITHLKNLDCQYSKEIWVRSEGGVSKLEGEILNNTLPPTIQKKQSYAKI